MPNRRSGFAVVVALLLLGFSLLLVLGLASLLRVEVRTSAVEAERLMARQNALLGLRVALGQLQAEMGTDQRISATAAQLDEDPETLELEGVAQPNWTGVWDSQERLPGAEPASGSPGEGQPDSFRAWLVSGLSTDPDEADDYFDRARSFLSSVPTAIELVAEGTLGTDADAAARVSVPRVVLASGAQRAGNFAYWVGDEGVKAMLSKAPEVADPDPVDALQRLATGAEAAMAVVDGWEAFDASALQTGNLSGPAELESTLAFALGGEVPTNRHFHSITSTSYGLLTDVVRGGWRRDLSLLFSDPVLPGPYQSEPLFVHGAARGPGWDYLQRFHDRYRQITTDENGLPILSTLAVRPETALREPPNLKGDVPLPVLARFQYLFSLYRGHDTLDGMPYSGSDPRFDPDYQSGDQIVYLMITPIVYWWNPYNIPLEMPSTADGQGAMGLLPGVPPIELSFDDGGNYLPVEQMFWVFAGELFAMNSSNVPAGEGFTIPPGGMVINSLQPLTYAQKLGVFPVDLRGDVTTGADGESVTNAISCFGALLPQYYGDFGQFERVQALAEGFRERDMGFFTPLLQPMPPGGERREMKLRATGTARIRVRFDPLKTWYVFKTHAGAGRTAGINPFAERDAAGVMNFRSPEPIQSSFVPAEYSHQEVISLASLQPLLDGAGNFTGLSPIFALNYDLRAFEEGETLGQPGHFSDPANQHFFSESSDEKAFAMAPFRFYFESFSENPVQSDPATGQPALRTESGDLISANPAKELLALPPLSLMQFSHAPLGRDYQHQAYQFSGEAALMSDNALWNVGINDAAYRNMRTMVNRAVGASLAHPELPFDRIGDGGLGVDRPFLLNEALFDSSFLSGLATPGGAVLSTPHPDGDPVTDRLQAFLSGSYELPHWYYERSLPRDVGIPVVESAIADGAGAREQVLTSLVRVSGAFNVNSTSVEAWAAMLSVLRDAEIPFLDYNSAVIRRGSPAEGTPVPLHSLPPAPGLDSVGANPASLFGESWQRFRTLTDARIREIAAALVAEVKGRGPFLSLADFINREVSGRPAYNRRGAVDAAIQQAAINTSASDPALDLALSRRFDTHPNASNLLDAAGFAEPEALSGDANAGLAGYITQADLLRPIAPRLSARSDTFLIRAYGDVVRDGQTVARAWCEAVVQRQPGYVDGQGGSALPWEDPSSAAEVRFGRRFEIISFRWLTQEEV